MSARAELERLGASVRDRFQAQKRILSFEEYTSELLSHPLRHTRDAARYLRDCFDFFGHYEIERPHGKVKRFKLFDQDFLAVEDEREAPGRYRLVGHERLQGDFYRGLSNFVREGRANRLLLLHGPNGSAKTTFAQCVMRALEHYAEQDEGALYRFSWIFPTGFDDKAIGFGGRSRRQSEVESFAHASVERVAAKLTSELREHPLLLLPLDERRTLITDAYQRAGCQDDDPPDWIWNGSLGHKNALVFDALLASYEGDLSKVLAHVQVERYYISRRYRIGAVTIGPQMSVDAGERQITADRTLHALPASLSAVSLFETFGELVDGSAGLIEYSDLLKRPLEAWKYLLLAIESGEVALTASMLSVNSVLLGSTNESHLEAFRQHPEYNSFRARLELLRVGYLLDYKQEQTIYDTQLVPHIQRHVAPHATSVAALWAVLTRLRQAEPERYLEPSLGRIAAGLTPMEKALLYALGRIPQRLDSDQAKLLRAELHTVVSEFEPAHAYEGETGASPREIRTLILDAAQHPMHRCLSPLAVLDQIGAFCEAGDYEFLRQKPDGGYHDHRGFIEQVRQFWFDLFDAEMRSSSGLVEESQYEDLFGRYVTQVSLWVKGERYRDPVTGKYEEPDQTLFKRIEGVLDVGDAEEFRRNLISIVAAHALDHPGEPLDHAAVFPRYVERVKEAYFGERRGQIGALIRGMLALLSDAGDSLDAPLRREAQAALSSLHGRGYCDHCARAALGELLKERYAD